ncbi:MAG: TRAP transporter substrate-binding protein DctP [Desulfobacteraceae bacterium]
MKKQILRVVVLSLIATVLLFAPAFAADKPIKIKYAHIGAPKTFESVMHAGAVAFKYVFEKRTNNRFQVDIYPGGTLGKEIDLMESVNNNVIQLVGASMGGLHRIFPPAILYYLPYVFRNEAVAMEVVDGPFGRKVLDGLSEKTGIRGLEFLDIYTFLTITNNIRPIRTPEDMKGIKFRGMDTLQVQMFKSLGASAVPVSFSELYTSLQTGVVHGQTNPAFLVAWMKLNEVQKYMTLCNSQYGYQMLVCNNAWFEGLSPEDQLAAQDAARAAKTASRGLAMLLEDKNIQVLKERGMQVDVLTDAENVAFHKIATPACRDWLKTQMDPEWVEGLMEAVKQAEEKLGYR